MGESRLVAADMDYARGEELRHLVQHVVQEGLDLGVGQLVEVAPDAAALTARRRPQPRIGRNRSRRMRRHLYLGHDRYAARGGVTHHLGDLLLRIVAAAVGIEAVPLLGRNVGMREVALGADLGQQRVFAYLDAPPGIVDQMPMKDVHLQPRHLVQQALDHIHALEMAAFVEHVGAPMVARGVVHLAAGVTHTRAVIRTKLPQRLQGVQQARRRSGLGGNAALVEAQHVTFGVVAPHGTVGDETYVGTAALAHDTGCEARLLQYRKDVGLIQLPVTDIHRRRAIHHGIASRERSLGGGRDYRRQVGRRSGDGCGRSRQQRHKRNKQIFHIGQ